MEKTDRLIAWDEDERNDENQNGIDDELEVPTPDVSAGSRELKERYRENPNSSPALSGGDVDAQWEMAESTGDEAAAGSNPTPGQNDVEEVAAAMGITYAADEELKVGEKERERDRKRWELDPASSEDYQERVKDLK